MALRRPSRGDLAVARETYRAAVLSLLGDPQDAVKFWKWAAYALDKAGCKVCGSATEPVLLEGKLRCPDCLQRRTMPGQRVVPHLEMARYLCRPERQRMLLEPRGSYKSTVGIEAYGLWRLVHDGNIRILLAGETSKIAEDSLRLLKLHLESDKFTWLHGNFYDATDRKQLWNKDAITVAGRTLQLRDPTIQIAGVDHAITGIHPDLVLVDDLVGSTNVGSEDMRQRVVAFVGQLLALSLPHTEFVFLGTRWHGGDYYGLNLRRAREEPGRFPVLIRDAEEGNRANYAPVRRFLGWSEERIAGPEGDMLFPEVLSPEFLAQQRHAPGMTSEFFSAQYKNKIVVPARSLGKPKAWLAPKDFPDNLRKVLAVDPAGGERTSSSFTGYWVAGIDPRGDVYVEVAEALDHTPSEILEHIFLLAERCRPNVTLFEKNDSFFHMLQREMRLRRYFIPGLRPVIAERRQTKEARIRMYLQPIYAAGIVTHSVFLKDKAYEAQLLHFEAMDRDDIVDAAAIGMSWLRPAMIQKAAEEAPMLRGVDRDTFAVQVTRDRMKGWRRGKSPSADPLFRRHGAVN